MFFEKNARKLEEFNYISQESGCRADYVQGGGGNVSVKLPDGLMAIKASGYCLRDISPTKAYAVVNYESLRKFFFENNAEDLKDVEKEGAACIKTSIQMIKGLEALRPSVEAGFHSILKTYVLHTHSVYTNLAACAVEGQTIASQALSDAGYQWSWVNYTDPGSRLTFAIKDELKRMKEKDGSVPSVILLQNHGVIVHDDDPNVCLAIHTDVNKRFAKFFNMDSTAFPCVEVQKQGDLYVANVSFLREYLKKSGDSLNELLENPLYPDQMVFLKDTLYINKDVVHEGQASADTMAGELLMNMDKNKAQTIAETLTAVLFIKKHVLEAGYHISAMNENEQNFIVNWESEKYRKALSEQKR